MELIKVTKKGSIHFKLNDGRLGVSYNSGYIRVSVKGIKNRLYQINQMIKVLEPTKWNADNYNYKRILVPTQYDRVNMLINFNIITVYEQ